MYSGSKVRVENRTSEEFEINKRAQNNVDQMELRDHQEEIFWEGITD